MGSPQFARDLYSVAAFVAFPAVQSGVIRFALILLAFFLFDFFALDTRGLGNVAAAGGARIKITWAHG